MYHTPDHRQKRRYTEGVATQGQQTIPTPQPLPQGEAPAPLRSSRQVSEKITRWIIFNVCIAVLPLAGRALILFNSGKAPSLATLLGSGDLLLVSCGIAAGAIGEIIGTPSIKSNEKIKAAGYCLLNLFLSAMLYGSITTQTLTISISSIILFISTLITSYVCVKLSEV